MQYTGSNPRSSGIGDPQRSNCGARPIKTPRGSMRHKTIGSLFEAAVKHHAIGGGTAGSLESRTVLVGATLSVAAVQNNALFKEAEVCGEAWTRIHHSMRHAAPYFIVQVRICGARQEHALAEHTSSVGQQFPSWPTHALYALQE